jgi:uncharacterized protein (DUF58 family)
MPAPELDENDSRLARILKRVRRIELLTRGLIKETLGGAYHSRFKGQGIEFDDFREYQAGDDVRFLDWNVTARMNEPYVRKYIEERELTVQLLIDVSGSGDYGSGEDSKRERAAEIAAVFAFSANHNGDKVGLTLFSDQIEHHIPARKGGSHTLRIIRDILDHRPASPRTDLTPALNLALQRIAHRALIIIVSDFIVPDSSWERNLRTLASKHDVVAAQITDPRELQLPNVGRITLEDPETGQQHIVNTSNPKVRSQYMERLTEARRDLQQLFKKANVECLDIRTDQDYAPAVTAYFRGRRKKKK